MITWLLYADIVTPTHSFGAITVLGLMSTTQWRPLRVRWAADAEAAELQPDRFLSLLFELCASLDSHCPSFHVAPEWSLLKICDRILHTLMCAIRLLTLSIALPWRRGGGEIDHRFCKIVYRPVRNVSECNRFPFIESLSEVYKGWVLSFHSVRYFREQCFL